MSTQQKLPAETAPPPRSSRILLFGGLGVAILGKLLMFA